MRKHIPVIILLALAAAACVMSAMRPTTTLEGIVWRWTGSAAAGVPAPPAATEARYTVEFRDDGTFTATADCNTISGKYRVVPGGRAGPNAGLDITPGPGTLAACGAGSASSAFVGALDRAAGYHIQGSSLWISLADGGSLRFEPNA